MFVFLLCTRGELARGSSPDLFLLFHVAENTLRVPAIFMYLSAPATPSSESFVATEHLSSGAAPLIQTLPGAALITLHRAPRADKATVTPLNAAAASLCSQIKPWETPAGTSGGEGRWKEAASESLDGKEEAGPPWGHGTLSENITM